MKRLLTSLAVSLMALASPRAHAQTPPRFVNVLVILDTSTSMSRWPVAWNNGDFYSYSRNATGSSPGCRQESIDALGYNPTQSYRQMFSDLFRENPYWFTWGTYYSLDGLGGAQQASFGLGAPTVDFSAPPLNTRTTTDITQACSNTGLFGTTAMAACKQCLQTKGYFQWSSSRRVTTANFLNFYSPRIHSAVSALTRLMRDTRMVRFSFVTFSPDGSVGTGQWAGLNTKLHVPFGPACSMYGDMTAYQMRQNDVIRQVQRGLGTTFDAPLTSAHYAAGHYFRSALVDPFPQWFGTFPTDSDFNDGMPSGANSVCFECDVNAILLLTASAPSEPGMNLPEEISTLPTPCVGCGYYAAAQGTPPGYEASHVHRVADWLRTHDLRADLPGLQQVPTFTIGLGMTDPEAINLLKATASAGGGTFRATTTTDQLYDALLRVIVDADGQSTCGTSTGSAAP